MGASSAVVGLPCRQLERGRKPCFLCDAPAPEDNARPVRAGKTASIDLLSVGRRHSFERHCGSVRSMPHGSFVGDTTPRVPSDATFGALNRRTRGLKSRPVSITRLQRRTNRLSSGWIPSHMLPRTSQRGCGCCAAASILGRVASCTQFCARSSRARLVTFNRVALSHWSNQRNLPCESRRRVVPLDRVIPGNRASPWRQ
jgi:hypothetical protein